jgi:hypothetical protein
MRAKLRNDMLLPNSKWHKTEHLLPPLAEPRTESEDPICDKPSTDSILFPTLPQLLRTEKLDPRCNASSTDVLPPTNA